MASKILQSLKDYLASTNTVRLAHLVRLELPGEVGGFAYYTDYSKDLTYDGYTFEAGKLKAITDVKQTATLSAYTVSIKLTGALQDEVDKAMQSQNYLNKKVSIWRVYLDENGDHIPFYSDGSTLLYFEGTTTEVSIDENAPTTTRGTSTITWKCANEFYDLEKVNGRLTDNATHRGLVVDEQGNEVGSTAAKRPEYIDDYGFFHANKSINILAKYQTKEKTYVLRKKSKRWWKGRSSYYMQEQWVDVTREIDMRFTLDAKYLPVIYGVQKVDGIPVFADTLADDPTKVYVVYAFCEGEIDGFLDIWMDDKPLVCQDSTDSAERTCFGVKRNSGNTISIATPTEDPTDPSIHGQEYILNDGDGQVVFWTYHGKPDQTAASVMVNTAAAGDFYLQNYGEEQLGPEYWDSRFKLLDTAYVIAIFDINENRTNIPTISAEVQGKKIKTYDANGLVSSTSTELNPVWQQLDYLTSPIYGAGVSLDRIDLDSFVEVAGILDTEDTSYQLSWVPYWRYLGWLNNTNNANKALIQTCPVLDTSVSIFKNMESMLQQSVSSLNIVEGKYTLSVESQKSSVADFTYGDLVNGAISVSDITAKNKFNSIGATITDPGLGWNNNEITFYNKDYKIEDDNVDKKSNLTFPYIINYYTARSLAERELKKSRFNREVSITVPFSYVDLPVNSPVTITYDRFSWAQKQFLIREVLWKSNGKIQLKLREYEDDIFINSAQVDKGTEQVPEIESKIRPPRDFQYVPATVGDTEGVNGRLRWLPSLTGDVTYYSLQISGDPETKTIPVNVTPVDPNVYLEYVLSNYPSGNYTFTLRAVSGSRGYVSSPVTLVVDLDPAKNLSKVEDFDLVNNIPGDETVWQGGDIDVSWTRIAEDLNGIVTVTYELEIYDGITLVNSFEILGTDAFTYTYAQNRADYDLINSPNIGVYRNLNFRIRAVGPLGEESIDWTTL